MKQIKIIPTLLLIVAFILSACAGPRADEPITGDFGPQYTPHEHQLRTFDALWTLLEQNYIYYKSANVNWDALQAGYAEQIESGLSDEEFSELIHKLESELPAGTITYQSRAERIAADLEDASTYEGIGAFVGFRAEDVPHIVVLGVIEGSPAEQAGIQAHDSIFEIDGNPVLLEEGINVVQRVRGPAGSTVTLSVQTPGKTERTVEVTRAQLVSRGKIEGQKIEGSAFGYILFPPVGYTNMMTDIRASLQDFTTNQKLEGLILDLRVAGSGGGFPLDDLLSLFHDGIFGKFYNSAGQEQAVSVQGEDFVNSQSIPLIVLVGQNTNGFPEIFAATLKQHKRAIVIGETTPGAIETTAPFYLPDGSRIYIETTSFKLPNGEEIGQSGLQPEIRVEAGWDDILPNADPVLEKAIEILGTQK